MENNISLKHCFPENFLNNLSPVLRRARTKTVYRKIDNKARKKLIEMVNF